MVYGRLSAGQIRLVPARAIYDGNPVSNPPGDFLEANHWKPVIFVLPPIPTGTEVYEMHWMEETNAIVQVWSLPSSNSSSSSSEETDPE